MIMNTQNQPRQKQLKQKWILQNCVVYPVMLILLLLLFSGLFLRNSPVWTRVVLSALCAFLSFSLAVLCVLKIENETRGKKTTAKSFFVPGVYLILGILKLSELLFYKLF